MYMYYMDSTQNFFQGVAICGRPLPWWGGEVLGHMSNGYNSLTFLFFFHVFMVFNIVAKR